MVSRAVDLLNPYLWIFFAGLFLGLGFGRFPFLYFRNSPGRQLGSRGWIFISSEFSLAVFSAAAAVFVTSGGLFSGDPVDLFFLTNMEWVPLISTSFTGGLLIRRFPRSAGIPLLILFSALIFFSFRIFGSWSSCDPEQEILRVKIVAEEDVSIVKFTFPPEGELISTIEGRGILPEVEKITCSPAFFFLGNGRLYRINGLFLSAPDGKFIPFKSPDSDHGEWGDLFVTVSEKLGFLNYSKVKPDGAVPGINETFSYFFNAEGVLEHELLPLF